MKTLTVRDVPDEVVESLHAQAKAGHRSVQALIRAILEREARTYNPNFAKRAAAWRKKMKGRNQGDCVDEIRQLRDSR